MICRRFFAIASVFCATLVSIGQSPPSHAVVSLVAGPSEGGTKLAEPFAVTFDPSGTPIVAEYQGNRVIKINGQGRVVGIAGTGRAGFSGDGGLATDAEFRAIHNVVATANGDLYIADTGNNRVRKVDAASGLVSTVVGTGRKGFSGDGGPAIEAEFGNIYSIAFDPEARSMYLADLDNRRIRKVDMGTKIVTTVAGNGKKGVPADGAEARSAPLVDPRAVAADATGNVYIVERSGNALRVVDRDGKIRTVVGTGKTGASGDGGPATLATMNGPKHAWIDRDGSVLIADTENHMIRRYRPSDGQIVKVAGTGAKGSAGVGGPPDRIQLNRPHGVVVDRAGDLFIADSDNHRVLKVAAVEKSR